LNSLKTNGIINKLGIERNFNLILKKIYKKKSQTWWYMPVIPGTW
jgi:hypothetical protein